MDTSKVLQYIGGLFLENQMLREEIERLKAALGPTKPPSNKVEEKK